MSAGNAQIIDDLVAALQSPAIDYGLVLDLATKIAQTDPDNIRFLVDASLITRLGRELVAKQETAVSELVKNAYDADATKVTLTFENSDQPGGRLVVSDNGLGMGHDQIISGFMRISTNEKVNEPYSPRYYRIRAGRKGIGRFAAQRLGKRLTIVTQTDELEYAIKVNIDWTMFESDIELHRIANSIEQAPAGTESGVTLIIEDLAEAWTEAQIQRVYRHIIDLIQPFPLAKSSNGSTNDPGFEVEIRRNVDGKTAVVAGVDKLVYEHALAEIDGKVDSKGKGKFTIKSKLLGINETRSIMPESPKTSYKYLSNIKLKAYYYIFDSEYIPKNISGSLRELSLERGGIRLYRNGFRVLPFGENRDDWLGLDEASARRSVLPPFGNRNFFGFVEITDIEGELFEETASREGLIENEAIVELKDLVFKTLAASVFRVAEAREKKKKPTKPIAKPEEKLRSIASEIVEAAEKIETRAEATHVTTSVAQMDIDVQHVEELRQAAEEIVQTANVVSQQTEALLNEIGMLRILASLGLTIGEFVHEIKHLLPSVMADVNGVLKETSDDSVRPLLQRLVENISHFGAYTAIFDRAIAENTKRDVESQELGVVLRRFCDVIRPSCVRYGIELPEPEINEYDLYTIPMHGSEWISILFNLFTNSQKAIRRAGVVPGKIVVSAFREGPNLIVDFLDNGDGIAPENVERIFDAFFSIETPSSPYENDNTILAGSGLGLKIVKDIVSSHDGNIFLIKPPQGFMTCFRIEIPAANGGNL